MISIGSNIDAFAHIKKAVVAFENQFTRVCCAPIYQSPPVGMLGDDFLNTVVSAQSCQPLMSTIRFLRSVEDASDRDRSRPKFSSRTLDLDLLICGDTIRHDSQADVPRAEILNAAYVLQPLADLAPDQLHPELDLSFAQLRNQLANREPDLFDVLTRISWTPLMIHRPH